MGRRRRVDGLIVREADDEILVLDETEGRIHQLNQTAAFIWRRCEDLSSPEEIARALSEAFDVREDEALRDVAQTLSKLTSLNLLIEH
jgi:hypothetical protein